MGHDVSVHEDVYRIHDSVIELSKVSRLLLAVDEGKVSKFAGQSLKNIGMEGLFGVYQIYCVYLLYTLEKRCFAKRLPLLKNILYNERLKYLNIPTLKPSRLHFYLLALQIFFFLCWWCKFCLFKTSVYALAHSNTSITF